MCYRLALFSLLAVQGCPSTPAVTQPVLQPSTVVVVQATATPQLVVVQAPSPSPTVPGRAAPEQLFGHQDFSFRYYDAWAPLGLAGAGSLVGGLHATTSAGEASIYINKTPTVPSVDDWYDAELAKAGTSVVSSLKGSLGGQPDAEVEELFTLNGARTASYLVFCNRGGYSYKLVMLIPSAVSKEESSQVVTDFRAMLATWQWR